MKKVFIIVVILIMSGALYSGAATNNDYCTMPLFMTNTVKPDIMVVMDFSGSMQFPAYVPCVWSGYDTLTALCGSSTSGVSGAPYYDSNRTYYAYFDSTKNYRYNTAGYFYENTCTPSTAGGCLPGNLLNFVTATRVDVSRKMLTGGRTKTISSQLTFDNEGANFTFTETNLHCRFTLSDSTPGDPTTRRISIANSGGTCTIGTLGTSNINVAISAAPTGIIDEFNDKVNFQTMIYNANSGNQGLIRSVKNDTLANLKNSINTQTPYNGTPTGEALWEAYDFFKQSNDHTGPNNSGAINKGNTSYDRDPWWDGTGSNAQAVPCRKSFVLLMSDGAYNGDVDPAVPARAMHVNDLRSDLDGVQNVSTYVVYAFGDLDPGTRIQGKNSMLMTALFGGHTYQNTGDWPYPFVSFSPSSTNCPTVLSPAEDQTPHTDIRDVNSTTFCNSRYAPSGTAYSYLSQCNPPSNWNTNCSSWDRDQNGVPDNYFEADDPADLEARLTEALNAMLRRASSGTAASVLASSEGSGANLLQAVFYPKRLFNNTEVDWISEIQNLWFYVDPWFRGATNIREDSIENRALDMVSDNVVQFAFNTVTAKTELKRYTPNSDGSRGAESTPSPDDIDNAYDIWKAGDMLFKRDITTSPRTIFTSLTGIEPHMEFSVANASFLQTYLQASTVTEAENIIKYIHGYDLTGYRNRTITKDSITNTWKLGDIISSTPRLKASFPLNSYHMYPPEGYRDGTYSQYVNDIDASGNSVGDYKERGMVYVGANDGMLHAFELGKLTFSGLGSGEIAKLETTDETLGTERWAFIPKGALPYLKYLTQTNYCHMFYIDNPVMISDASVNDNNSGLQNPIKVKDRNSWRTILIGSMGIGGACRNMTSTCNTTTDCVKTPINNVGYSSYFALDITDPVNPKVLWEFSRDDLGFATTGPAIMRLGDPAKNGKWFAVFASGPTGPINTTYHQFMGSSDQNLKIFVLDLLQGPAASVQVFDTGITNAFGGSLFSATLDIDRNNQATGTPYQDDVLYLGYTKKDMAAGTWTKGGVVRLLTNNNLNPASWTVGKFIDNVGPVTSAVTKLIDTKKRNLWVYFGTGRYFYRLDNGMTIDDPTNQQALYGIKEPCYTSSNTLQSNCTTQVVVGDLTNKTTPSSTVPARGWYINLDAASTTYKAERVITDPLAIYSGIVFFTTVAPSSDVCSFGGKTALWFPWYETGGLAPPAALSRLEAMLQVSTGEIVKIGFTTSTTNPKVAVASGIPSKDQGLSVFVPPAPLRRVLHMKEK
jgi:type IV pilus assembly protein PilY1